jgi:ABC-2 type transport system ATP-binding protein
VSLILKNISKTYGAQHALKNINFELQKGEIVGFLGPNGAGKSTTMKIIAGAIQPTSGNVFLNNVPIDQKSHKIKKSIGYLSEKNPLYEDMYVLEYLRFNAGIYKVANARINEIVEKLDLASVISKKINQLSKGYKQRVGLAAAILHDPLLLILDEPTSGLDPNQLTMVRLLIKKLAEDKMILFSSHIMQEILAICDRVIFLNKGEIVADKMMEDLKNEEKQSIEVEFDSNVDSPQLSMIPFIAEWCKKNDNSWLLTFNTKQDMRSTIFDFANAHQLRILQMNQHKKTLEDIFKSLTQ